ncbi:MAG TPA: cytochrome c oxidase assembly protein [Ktedonobacterales bacterium]
MTSPSPWSWNLEPVAIVALLLLLGGYLWAASRVERETHRSRRTAAFVAGWLTLALTVLSPLDTVGRHYLVFAREAQLFVIITVVAPLLMLGVSDELMARLIPLESLRRGLSRTRFTVTAVVFFNLIILIWQIPRLVDSAATNAVVHDLQFVFWLIAGVLDWWPLLTPLRREARLARMTQVLYLAVESVPLDAFGVFLLFAQQPIYPVYALVPRLWGISAMLDQQLAGALVAVPGNIIDFFLMSLAFFGWIHQQEQAQIERENAEHLEELRDLQGEPGQGA